MWAIAGDFPDFEEASRALYAGDGTRLRRLTRGWPKDVRAHLLAVAQGADRPDRTARGRAG
jgi:hypothetical protein